MQTALILMTILGCDDSVTQCNYVEMIEERWATIQECDAASEDRLKDYSNIDYPVVVAVCQTPEDAGLSELAGEPGIASPAADGATGAMPPADSTSGEVVPAEPVPEAEQDEGLAARVLSRFTDALPDAETLKSLVTEPVHVVTDGYSWVARRFEK